MRRRSTSALTTSMAGGQSTKTSGDAGSQGAQEFLTSSVGLYSRVCSKKSMEKTIKLTYWMKS